MPETFKGLKGYDAGSPMNSMGHLGVKTKNSTMGSTGKSANNPAHK